MVSRLGLLVEELGLDVCLGKLGSATLGRLGVNVAALPVVVPVNFVVDANSIVFRMTPGARLMAAMDETVVAFEVDDYDAEADRGWSVLVQGIAREIKDSERLNRVRALPLRPITPDGSADRFVEVKMVTVTGREVKPLEETDVPDQR